MQVAVDLQTRSGRNRSVCFWLALLLTYPALSSARAHAEAPAPAPSVDAEALFRRGKERLATNDYAAACPLLADSYRADPATGSLLALALCHERQGKLASALREYELVAARSRDEGRADRERAARTQADALRARVSTLTLSTEDPATEVTLFVNGVRITPDQLRQPLPIDGGFVLVEANAPDRAAWQKRLTIADSGEAAALTVPTLSPLAPALASGPSPEPVQAARAPTAPAPSMPRPPRSERRKSRLTTAQWTGIGLMAAGAAGAGVAIGYTVRAVHKNDVSMDGCVNDVCTPEGRAMRLDARQAGNIATIAASAAATFAAAGLITFLVGRAPRDRRTTRAHSVRLTAWLGAGSGGSMLTGDF